MLLEFSRAFDKISHTFLLSNVHYYGIRNHRLRTQRRTQTTVVSSVHSCYAEVTSGVPQGSVLRPMLFQLFINGINNAITSKIKLFAYAISVVKMI